jgi:hypothetical protein
MAKLINKVRIMNFVLVLILVGAFGVRLYKIDNPVADWHAWRQADTASVSKVFLNEGIDLLRPRYHDISKIQTGYENPVGYRYVEFPVFNAIHATAYKIVPQIPFDMWGRLVSVITAIITTYLIYGIGKLLFSKTVGLASAFFYAFLPFNIYFTRVILPDPMSVSLGVASVYFFARFAISKKIGNLLAFSVLLSLAILVKPHALFFALPSALIFLTHFKLADLFKNKWFFVAADIILIPFLLWRVWMYQPGLIRGIAHWEWSFNGNGIRFRPAFFRWIFAERLGKLILGYWGVFPFVYGVLAGRKINVIHAFLAGAVLYVTIFASANVMHDYYQVFIVPAVALALGYGTISIWKNNTFQPIVSKLLLLAVVAFMFGFSFYEIRGNYRVNDTGAVEAGREADRILPKDALVIAPYNGDTTFLYQTGRFGWPAVTTSIDEMIAMGADYFISTNLSDQDSVNFSRRFEEVKRTDRYVILDLNKEKAE